MKIGLITFIFAWYDFWVGWFWDSKKRRLYIFPVPMFGLYIQFKVKPKICFCGEEMGKGVCLRARGIICEEYKEPH